jgi:hypothetical protein
LQILDDQVNANEFYIITEKHIVLRVQPEYRAFWTIPIFFREKKNQEQTKKLEGYDTKCVIKQYLYFIIIQD